MSTGASPESIEGALQSAFGGGEEVIQPTRQPAIAVEPEAEALAEAQLPDEAAPEGEPEALAEPEQSAEPVAEPEFEIEVSGQKQIVRGKEQIVELLQKAADYSQKSEQNARARESLVAQAQLLQLQQQFLGAVQGDIAELRGLDAQLEQYSRVDWSRAFDEDPFNAMKLREQRDSLKDQRSAKFNELSQKQEQFKAGQAQASANMLASEEAAMIAKIPEWRNSEKAQTEKREIAQMLVTRYGYQPAEIAGLMDHRILVAARDLLNYQRLQAAKTDRTKQVRDAPPVVKPGTTAPKQTNSAEFTKVRAHLRKLGAQGNHKGQEALVTKMLTDTFK